MVESVKSFSTYNVGDGNLKNLTASFSEKLKGKFPGKVPVIITLDKLMTDFELTRTKFLVDSNVTVGAFQYTLRKYIVSKKSVSQKPIDASTSLFIFYGNPPKSIPRATATIGEVYEEHASEGFLNATVLRESTFG